MAHKIYIRYVLLYANFKIKKNNGRLDSNPLDPNIVHLLLRLGN